MIKTFLQPLYEDREFLAVREFIGRKKAPVQVSGCTSVQKSHFVSALGQEYPYRLIVTANELRAKEMVEDMRLYDRNVCLYPAKDVIFYSADVHGNAIVKERMLVLKKLLDGEPCTVITSVQGLLDRLLPLEEIRKSAVYVCAEDAPSMEELREKLVTMGYQKQAQVENPGEFAVRGGILDIFPLSEDTPYRIEYWGEDIDSIRSFDISSQRSIENVSDLTIYPAMEFIVDEEELQDGIRRIEKEAVSVEKKLLAAMKTEEAARVRHSVDELKENLTYFKNATNLDSYITYFRKDNVSLLSYFPEEETLFVLDEPDRIDASAEATSKEFAESMTGRLEKGYILPGQTDAIFDYKKVLAQFGSRRSVLLTTLAGIGAEWKPAASFDIFARSVASYNRNFEALVHDLSGYRKNGYRTLLVCGSHTRAARLAENLREHELSAFFSEDPERVVGPQEIMVVYGNLHQGFEYPMLKFVVIDESDIFGREKKKHKKATTYSGAKINALNELESGDYVVHENHGVAVYRGIEQITTNKIVKDYIKLEYGDGGVLYVPATGLDVIQKYADSDAAKKPKLNKLNGSEWKTTKTRVYHAVKDIAADLIKLYAIRQEEPGHAFCKDTVWQKEFEELFPYEETEDQVRAIEDTKRDMESTRIMDRLICGDVGFGKTEIAIRAAFKAVSDGKQVAVLVPTTILAQQHYNTFSNRLRDFPFAVDMMCRFRTAGEQKKTLERLRKGQVDILIGTHRILSKDVEFKNLGLLIVDEEQRFGVTHKEKIKQLRKDVDALTLTATPIPRTLHMSLIGIRDMSVLEEPPQDRVPIQTFVLERNEEMIREAINRELNRGGQVYYVVPRVAGIEDLVGKLHELCPEANVAFAHGQMSERQLEDVMFDFINGDIDVLVSTTIIETGMDISNVNTIIIDDADRFGLSQLYQLRGRVGRSNRTAYAFILYRTGKLLTEVAEKRLAAIREYSDLGSGIKISMRDLEIRGAGDLLGAAQSGHMEAVGYDLYCKMLNEAVRSMKGETVAEENFETTIDADLDAYIPSNYIRNEMQKLDMYKRIAGIESEDELSDMQEELCDRYGDMPNCVNLLLHVALLKAKAHQCYVEKLTLKRGFLVLSMYQKARLQVGRIPEFLKFYGRRISMTPGNSPKFTYTLETAQDALGMLAECMEVLRVMREMLSEEKGENNE
ncbi:MAG: transcription-repair coupling factor [Lachnospiraceae bacterium]|nr:transcription-repair coupling factor [Lachnospiraceae bacterium]